MRSAVNTTGRKALPRILRVHKTSAAATLVFELDPMVIEFGRGRTGGKPRITDDDTNPLPEVQLEKVVGPAIQLKGLPLAYQSEDMAD